MFGLGAGELVLILVIALIVFGPEKIPEIARWLGKTSADLRRMSDAVRREFYNGIYVPPPEPPPGERRSTASLVPSSAATGSIATESIKGNSPEPCKEGAPGSPIAEQVNSSEQTACPQDSQAPQTSRQQSE